MATRILAASRKAASLRVECMECGKRFRTASMLPECPKCGGTDIDISNAADVPVSWVTGKQVRP